MCAVSGSTRTVGVDEPLVVRPGTEHDSQARRLGGDQFRVQLLGADRRISQPAPVGGPAQSSSRTTRVKLDGYTDQVGGEKYNQALAQKRANMVRDFLVKYGAGPRTRSPPAPMGRPTRRFRRQDRNARFMNRRVAMTVTDGAGKVISAGGISDALNAMTGGMSKEVLRGHPQAAGPPRRDCRPAAQAHRGQRRAPEGTGGHPQEPGRPGRIRPPDEAGRRTSGRRRHPGCARNARHTGVAGTGVPGGRASSRPKPCRVRPGCATRAST